VAFVATYQRLSPCCLDARLSAAFDALCRAATRREFAMVMAWSVDRLGRSLQNLVGFLSELHALRIDLYLHQQGLDTTTPAGKALHDVGHSTCGAP
jgi:DNA invertase Pin-like site-specific DNA recombinase